MGAADPVPVTVVTGFLGAGKTTLVNRWLARIPRGTVSVIVNEHGSIGVDGAMLAARVRNLVEITGGCVCCSTQGDLVRALGSLGSARPPPGRILVETSGAASPAGVLRAITAGARSGTHVLDGVVTVVDATRLDVLDAHDLAIEQVGYADVLVLSRADRCDPESRDRARASVAARNGAAFVVMAARGEVDDPAGATLDALLDHRRADFAPAATNVPPPGPAHVYESVSLVHDGEIDGERFTDFMESEVARWSGRLFRTKGILAIAGVPDRVIVQGVADLVEVTFGDAWRDAPRTSRFVVVGFGLDREALTRAFRACLT